MRRLGRAAIVLMGLVASQFALYGSSLLGRRILLPLDLLIDPYTQSRESIGLAATHDRLLSDPICQIEPMRRFAIAEVRAGRLPLWDPYNYCGAPFLANNQSAVLSPFRLLDYIWPDPRALAWGQMLRAVVGGFGAYCFFRRATRATFLASAIGAWIWPLGGFLVLWTMWPISAAALWLPWVLLAVYRAVRRPSALSVALLAAATAAALLSGHSATAAQALLAAGIYAIWLLARGARRGASELLRPMVYVALGFASGFALAAPQLLPTFQYMRESLRVANRLESGSETKPVGAAALPQLVLPWIRGTTRTGWIYLGSDIPLESAIGGYVGLLSVLVAAPFGFADCRRRKRAEQIFWFALAVLGSAYVLDLPGAAALHRLPPLNLLRANRFVFVTGFAMLAAGVAGLDALLRGRVAVARGTASRWLLIAPALSIALAAWCVWRASIINTLVERRASDAIARAGAAGLETYLNMLRVVDGVASRFRTLHLCYAALCILAAILATMLWHKPSRRLGVIVALAAVAEVLASAWPVNPQSDASLYNRAPPALAIIREAIDAGAAEPGRICGVGAFPPMMNRWAGLSDIRGYDAADPMRYVEFLELLRAPGSPPPDPSAATFAFVPRLPSPLADFINLRYLVYSGRPRDPSAARFVVPGYYVVENAAAMPRVSVPRRAVVIANESDRLAALRHPNFDPRETVILETNAGLAAGGAESQGEARIVSETPSRVEIEYSMRGSGVGLIVLADAWDAGWRARLADGSECSVLRANHAFRAVAVPAGHGRVTFSYEPRSFTIGLWTAAATGAFLIVWCSMSFGVRRIRRHA
jgi:hypothetical protein